MKRLTLRPRLSYEPLANTKWVCAPNTISRTDRLAVCQTLRARIETGGEDGHHAEQDRSERKRTPPVLPERGEPMRGPPIVKAPNWLTHLEFDWKSPLWRPWLEALGETNQVIRYDERGAGLSDWEVEDFSLDAWVADLEAVVDAAGVERFTLLGLSQGAQVAIAYAVRHPERVSHLVVCGGYLGGDELTATERERSQALDIVALN
jgi:pimeloyl-ACP methyl ester carboxylesterase